MEFSFRLYLVFLTLLYLERLVELFVSRRNMRQLIAGGATEYGLGHFRFMAVFHALFPVAAAMEVWLLDRVFPGPLGYAALGVALSAQGLRWWAVHTLAGGWTVKIIVPPHGRPVTRGPYRFLRHPNYLAVALEVTAVPLVHGAWLTGLLATLINSILLGIRIRAEERAWGARYGAAFAGRSRFIPGVGGDS